MKLIPITIELDDEQWQELAEMARRQGITLQQCMLRILDLAIDRDQEFKKDAQYIIEKNSELYPRLK